VKDRILSMTVPCQTVTVESACVDTTWTCREDRLEHSNCGNTRVTTPCNLSVDAMEMIIGTRPIDLRYDVNNNGIVDTGDATLLANGTPLRELTVANITAVDMTVSSVEYNTIEGTIWWENIGESIGILAPKMRIDLDLPIEIGEFGQNIPIVGGETLGIPYIVTGVSAGDHTICPVPN